MKKLKRKIKTAVPKRAAYEKTRSDRNARREKASALTRLRIAFFLAAGGLSLQGCGIFYLLFRHFLFRIVDNSEKIF